MKKQKFFCCKNEGKYSRFYSNKKIVELVCANREDEIVEVKIEKSLSSEPKYYGWWDNEKKEVRHIYQSEIQVRVCFPDMAHDREKKGKGKIIGLDVNEI